MRTTLRSHRALFGVVVFYIAISWSIAYQEGYLDRFSFLIYSRPVLVTTLLIGVLFFAYVMIKIMIVDRPQRLTRAIYHEVKDKWLTAERLGQGIVLILLFMVFMACFSSMKSMIPVFHPYDWDKVLFLVDRRLHGDVDPWVFTHAVLGGHLAIFVVNFLYNLWFPVMFAVLYWQFFSLKDRLMQKRFLLAFYLCWIVNGTLLATWLSSAGPCFYALLFSGEPDPYVPLMNALHEADLYFDVFALTAQEMLWTTYEKNGLSLGSGISAMPSMHVSVAFLLMLFGHQKSRLWGYAFAFFFVTILIGSVHLGWHYAVDGYLAMFTTALIWYGVCRFVKE